MSDNVDKIVDILHKRIRSRGQSDDAIFAEIAQQINALQNEWISVRESNLRPKAGDRVIALRHNGSWDRAEYNSIYFEGLGAWYLPEGPTPEDADIVTHWHPLPKPPATRND